MYVLRMVFMFELISGKEMLVWPRDVLLRELVFHAWTSWDQKTY